MCANKFIFFFTNHTIICNILIRFFFKYFNFLVPVVDRGRNICHGSDRDLISKVIAGSNLSI